MKLKHIWSILLLCGCLYNPLYASFTVTSNADTPDALVGDGTCADASGNCTLRAAIQEANSAGVNCLITFSIGFGGLITLSSSLPVITTDLIISGGILGNVTIDGAGMYAAFNIDGTTVSMSDLIIQNTNMAIGPAVYNNAGNVSISNSRIHSNGPNLPFGGAIYNDIMGMMTIHKSVIEDNTTEGVFGGGGLFNQSDASVIITESTFRNNTSSLGSDMCSDAGVNGRRGGALYNRGQVVINSSTFSGNATEACNATDPGGGAIYGESVSSTTLVNSTVSGNRAVDGAGGGISMEGLLILDNCTIVENEAAVGGGLEARTGDLEITSTIIANSTPASIRDLLIATATDILVNNNNLIETCGSVTTCDMHTFFLMEDPQLKALADNGGCTRTHLPCTSSPVIDAGLPPSSGSTDQRGLSAPVDSPGQPNASDGTDIGSVELQVDELPVELISFQVKIVDTQVLLDWETASEVNNSGFEVQRSQDTKSWEVLTFIKGFGTSLASHTYKWVDETALEGQAYYRLRQLDYDQQFSYSAIQSIYLGKENIQLNLFPNPVREQLFFQFSSDWSEESCLFLLHDAHGRLVREWVRYDNAPLPLDNLPKGIYILSAYYDRLTFNELLVKK